MSSAEWHSTIVKARNSSRKAALYVTNFPENIPLVRLRQAFEVCGILSDVYMARHRNARGQEFGFVRYVNVKNIDKLVLALNNVWIDNCRVWASEAKFNMFAHNDEVVALVTGVTKALEVKGLPVVRNRRKGVKNVRWGNSASGEKGEGVVKVTVGKVEVLVVGKEGRKKIKRVEEAVRVVEGGENTVKGQVVKVGLKVGEEGMAGGVCGEKATVFRFDNNNVKQQSHTMKQQQHMKQQSTTVKQQQHPIANVPYVPIYITNKADRTWASTGMVATVIAGNSAVAMQQRVDDAGFPHVVVTPMGGDKVFLHCSDGGDIWEVFNNALHFFELLFANLQKWSPSEVRYERGHGFTFMGCPFMHGMFIS